MTKIKIIQTDRPHRIDNYLKSAILIVYYFKPSNQFKKVHYLVREYLLDIEDLKREHEGLYKQLQSCYGLERCLSSFNLLESEVGKVE